jgi:hypothetical protein
MIRYSLTMSTRVVCVILCFFVHGWWLVLPVTGAFLLPYIAVVLANVASRPGTAVVRPGSVVRVDSNEQNKIDG